MFYKTRRDTETGMKLQAVADKMAKVRKEALSIMDEVGATSIREVAFGLCGGISSFQFKRKQDVPSCFKKVSGGFMPKVTTEVGKEIQSRIDKLPSFPISEFNDAVGFDGGLFKTIGINMTPIDYVLFRLHQDWEFTPKKDCTEITHSEYRGLTKKETQ